MPRSSSFASSRLPDDELFVLAKETRRLEPLFLVSALHANDDADDETPPSQDATLAVSAADNMRLLAQAFHPDDEITVEAPSPELPKGTPSPLGDDVGDDPSATNGEPVSGARRRPSDLMSERTHAAPVAKPVSSRLPVKYDVVPDLPLLTAHVQRSIWIRHSVSPDAVQAARAGREAARLARAAEARTRMIVLTIWGMAVMLAALLAFVATSA